MRLFFLRRPGRSPLSRGAAAPLAACAAAALLFAALHLCLPGDPFAPSPYSSYTLQALAWRSGRAWLEADVPYLELALYEGRRYVSFPPVPSVPVFLLTFVFGGDVPDGMLNMLYALCACAVLCRLLERLGWRPARAAALAVLLCLGSSLLPLALSGAVWYQAQVLAFLLTALSVERMQARRPLPALLCWALAVGCRPLNVLYGPALLIFYALQSRRMGLGAARALRSLAPGAAAALAVALAMGAYNLARFGNPFEFGHHFLPEFSTQGGDQFSLAHIGGNVRNFVFSWPFEATGGGWAFKQFGFSLFLANPALLWLAADLGAGLVTRSARPGPWSAALCLLLQLLALLSHRTFGGFQYGARYAADLIPYAALHLAYRRPGPRSRLLMELLLAAGLVMAAFGSCAVRLPA